MTRRRRARAVRWTIALLALGAGAAGCSSSSGQGLSLARQACVHVDRSVSLYLSSEHVADQTQANAMRNEAGIQLDLAEPLAARATSANGQWNGLMTTIGESSRVDESELIPTLQDLCEYARSS
jgi:hypothetical protein